jgi:hypothetical protein
MIKESPATSIEADAVFVAIRAQPVIVVRTVLVETGDVDLSLVQLAVNVGPDSRCLANMY